MKRSATRTKKVINITFLPVKQYKYQIFSTIKKTIMENKYFIDKIANIYVSTLCKHNYIFINIYGFLSYFLYHRFLPFFTFLYHKLDSASYSLELVSSFHVANETTSIYSFLSHNQSSFRLMNTDYCRNITICLSVHQIFLELSFQFSVLELPTKFSVYNF